MGIRNVKDNKSRLKINTERMKGTPHEIIEDAPTKTERTERFMRIIARRNRKDSNPKSK